jgi:hypothetical protein
MAKVAKRGNQRRAQAFDREEIHAHDQAFGGEGVGEHKIQAHRGSRPPVLGEDALLQPVISRRFGVGEQDAHVA